MLLFCQGRRWLCSLTVLYEAVWVRVLGCSMFLSSLCLEVGFFRTVSCCFALAAGVRALYPSVVRSIGSGHSLAQCFGLVCLLRSDEAYRATVLLVPLLSDALVGWLMVLMGTWALCLVCCSLLCSSLLARSFLRKVFAVLVFWVMA